MVVLDFNISKKYTEKVVGVFLTYQTFLRRIQFGKDNYSNIESEEVNNVLITGTQNYMKNRLRGTNREYCQNTIGVGRTENIDSNDRLSI